MPYREDMSQTETVAVKSLRERIAEVNAADDSNKAENEAKVAERRRKDLREQLKERLSVEVDESAMMMRDHETPIVEVEGFRFTLGSPTDFDNGLSLIITCGACGKEYQRSIWSLNSMADRFVPYPHSNNYCLEREQPPTPLTTELRLIQVLRDFIAENSLHPSE